MHPFVALMRRYCNDYTNRHDLAICEEIMAPDYTLHMGGHVVAGRDGAYKPAAQRQFSQFPGLCLTVNQLVCSGDRLALRFSEHGGSSRHGGARATWRGIGLYHWDGTRLRANYVEQDYFGRSRQLTSGEPDPMLGPAVAPWDTQPSPANRGAEAAVRRWLAQADPASTAGVVCDDGSKDTPAAPLLDVDEVEVDDLFSAGSTVAFHAAQLGTLRGDAPDFPTNGHSRVHLHMSGIVTVASGEVTGGWVVRDRRGLSKRLRAATTDRKDA